MSLLSRLRQKQSERAATAIPAISAIQPKGEAATVARIATIAVAKPQEPKPDQPMTDAEVQAVRAWLTHINETDPAEVQRVIHLCQTDLITRGYVLLWASEIPKPPAVHDDRRTCQQCANLLGKRCAASFRGELNADRRYEPITTINRRCPEYKSKSECPHQSLRIE